MPLRPLEFRDRPVVEDLLLKNPFKQNQIEFQRLDRESLASFHLHRLMGRLDSSQSPLFLMENGREVGIFGFQVNKKHSDFFEKLVFILDLVISYKLDRPSIQEALVSLKSRMVAQGAQTIWGQCEEADTDLVQSFGRAGADYCGTSMRMSLWLEKFKFTDPPEGLTIRSAEKGDRGPLREIATRSHRHSRFFRDPHLPEEKKREIFPDYLESCQEAGRPCLVAVDGAGRVSGFSLLVCPEGQEASLGRRIGIVDFIAVDPERQGGGVGGALLAESLRSLKKGGYELVELKTQLDNWEAIGFYSRWGFRPISAETHYSFGKKGTEI